MNPPLLSAPEYLVGIRISPKVSKVASPASEALKERGKPSTMSSTKEALEKKKPQKQQHTHSNKSSTIIYDLILWILARISLSPTSF